MSASQTGHACTVRSLKSCVEVRSWTTHEHVSSEEQHIFLKSSRNSQVLLLKTYTVCYCDQTEILFNLCLKLCTVHYEDDGVVNKNSSSNNIQYELSEAVIAPVMAGVWCQYVTLEVSEVHRVKLISQLSGWLACCHGNGINKGIACGHTFCYVTGSVKYKCVYTNTL